MKSFLSVLLLSAVSMLPYTKGQHEYNSLTSTQKTIVDRAIDHINKKENTRHINFEKTLFPRDISEVYTNFKMYLKETSCSKITQTLKYEHRPDCLFRGKRFNCVVCKNAEDSDFYINCLRVKLAHKNEEERNRHCNMYHHGIPLLGMVPAPEM